MTTNSTDASQKLRRQLSLFDCVSIIVGIIIGSGIYETTPLVASSVPDVGWLTIVWIAGGFSALIGALCYAELATAYPRSGGEYVFLARAFGQPLGFLFAWMQFWVIGPGTIGAMGFVFGRYATAIAPLGAHSFLIYATVAVVLLTAVNMLGVREGKWTQNALSVAKVVGLLALIVIGFQMATPNAFAAPAQAAGDSNIGLAMILVLYAYGGWSALGYVAAEVSRPEKNIFRSLLAGVILVTIVYVLANLAFAAALGFEGLRGSSAVAADVAALASPRWGRLTISVLVCLSALGAINAQILTEARIYYAVGQEYRLFGWLGRWSARHDAPINALATQAVVTLALVGCLGLESASSKESAFERLVYFGAPAVWGFMLIAGVSVVALRRREPDQPRPFRVPLYPWTVVAFCSYCAFMVYASVDYIARQWRTEPAWMIAAAWLVVSLAVGAVLAWMLKPVKSASISD